MRSLTRSASRACCSQEQTINIVPVTIEDVPSVFLHGATFVMQKHLENTLGFEYKGDNDLVNGLRGHLITVANFNKPALLAILERYGIAHIDYL